MTQIDPEQFLDEVRAGRAAVDGGPELDPISRLELSAASGFDDLSVPRPGDAELLQASVDGALAELGPAAPAGGGSGVAGIAAGALVVVGVAAALVWARPDASPERRADPAPVVDSESAEPETLPSALSPSASGTVPAAELEPPATAEPARPEPPPARRGTAPREETDRQSAAELLAAANAARRAGELKQSLALYDQLSRRFPGAREELTARVSRGRLWLDELHRPRAAVSDFSAYLKDAPGGNLAEEARAGLALAHQALGDVEREREAWRDLLRHHPGSVHAARARERLE